MIISGAEIRSAFRGQLIKVSRMPKMGPALAVLLLSNLSVWGENIPLAFFAKVNFDFDRLSVEHLKVLCGILQKADKETRKISLDPPQRVRIADFMLQSNEARAFRPARKAEQDSRINEPFDPNAFNYLKTNPEECFKRAEISDMRFDFLFHMYPFAPFNFVLVPEKEKQHNQFFSEDQDFARRAVTNAWLLVKGCRDKSLRLGFNAMGAYGSVNHFHFQGFFVAPDWQLPIDEFICETGSLAGWHVKHAVWLPASTPGMVEKTLLHIRRMHELYQRGQKVSFNLYITPQGIGIMPRRHQGVDRYFDRMKASGFTTGFAFYELLGEVICPSQAAFDQLLQGKKGSKDIQEIFDTLSLDENPFVDV